MHPFDQPEVIAGQGTIGIELDEQVPDVDTVLVAIGGGGLIAGIAAWFRGRVRVVGVEPVTCATMTAAFEAGESGRRRGRRRRGRFARLGPGRRPHVPDRPRSRGARRPRRGRRDPGGATRVLGRVPADRGAGRCRGVRRAAFGRVSTDDRGAGLRPGVRRELRPGDGHPIPFLRCCESAGLASAQPIPPLIWAQG